MTEIRNVAVAGSGTMGAGIAIVAARGGYTTTVYDTNQASLDRARDGIESFFDKSVQRGKLKPDQVDHILDRLVYTDRIDALAASDLVIEAVFEDMGVKHALYRQLDDVCEEHTIFASNTSTLSITELAGGSGRDDRFVGMHFCLPAQLMKLVEMSAGLNTTDETFQAAWDACTAMGQQCVKTQDTPGFVLNYFVVPFNNDAIRAVEAGVAEPADIDRAVKLGLGYAMGPCELLDLIGLDTQILLCEAFHKVTHDPRAACPPLLRRMVAAGRLGRKSGRGFYTYGGSAMYGA
ncbi:MAG: 3-hydroxyacyl-CoA dehydrogenase family protein [Alphaproteobacteria bacterium]